MIEQKLNNLYSLDNKEAYKILLELELLSTESDELYNYFDDLLRMLNNEKTYVRVRGFRLICAVAKYDIDDKINKNIDIILKELDDPTATSVRQCLSTLNLIVLYKVELSDIIENKLNNINLSLYKESMQSLIQKDIDNILKNI